MSDIIIKEFKRLMMEDFCKKQEESIKEFIEFSKTKEYAKQARKQRQKTRFNNEVLNSLRDIKYNIKRIIKYFIGGLK